MLKWSFCVINDEMIGNNCAHTISSWSHPQRMQLKSSIDNTKWIAYQSSQIHNSSDRLFHLLACPLVSSPILFFIFMLLLLFMMVLKFSFYFSQIKLNMDLLGGSIEMEQQKTVVMHCSYWQSKLILYNCCFLLLFRWLFLDILGICSGK